MRDTSTLARERTSRVDELIRTAWPSIEGFAVAAVGGYGRGELFPYSDIDLLFFTKRTGPKDSLADFLRGLWDAGLHVSQSVRSPEECLEVNEQNVELSVSLLDRRFLAGERALFDAVRDPPGERLAPALAKLTRERHARYGNTIFHLEPHVKEAPGAMRDLQVLRWLSQLQGLAASGPPHELLFQIRTELHLAAGRDQNVLNYAMQDECAGPLGFASADDLMRAYYRSARPIFRATLRALDETGARRTTFLSNLRDRATRQGDGEFLATGGRVHLRAALSDDVLVRLLEFVGSNGVPLANETEKQLAALGTPDIGWNELRRICELPYAATALRAMHATGILRQLFPELNPIESLVIRDYYHRYTVDEHTMVAIEVAERLRREQGEFAELARETSPYSLLLIALLFHDTGKGSRSERHTEASEETARRALNRIGAPVQERETISFLVRRHLDMSRLMLTRDLGDPITAAALADLVGTTERLRFLTVLTYCDISAVNPEALTPWRSTLLWQLYVATARHLTRGLQNEIAEEGLPARYVLTHTTDEVAEHHRMERTGIVAKLERLESAYRLTVVAPDKPFLFALAAGALASFGMNILRAEAFGNVRHMAIETFTFDDPMRTLDLNPTELGRLEELVTDAIEGRKKVEDLLLARKHPRRPRGSEPAHVSFDNTASDRATLFEITAEDRPGLLFDLARAISAKDCNIEVVLVDTEGRKAIDVFYVTRFGKPLDAAAAVELQSELSGASA